MKINLKHVLVLFVVALVIYWGSNVFETGSNAVTEISSDFLGYGPVITGTTESGDVAIELKPARFETGKLMIGVTINTHSVDLDQFDLTQITTLEIDGKKIKPSSAPILQGHHNSGEMVFDVGNELNGFSIQIEGIPKVEKRFFEWSDLK